MISRASEDASKHWNLSNDTLLYLFFRPRARTRVDLCDHFCAAGLPSRYTTNYPQDLGFGFTGRVAPPEEDRLDFFLTTRTFIRKPLRFGTMKIIVSVTSARGHVSSTGQLWPIYRYQFKDIILQTV